MGINSEFLLSLQVGEQVLLKDRRLDVWGRDLGFQVYVVESLSAKRTKIVLRHPDGRLKTLDKFQCMRICPVTAEALAEIAEDTKRILARRLLSDVTDALSKLDRQTTVPAEQLHDLSELLLPVKEFLAKIG